VSMLGARGAAIRAAAVTAVGAVLLAAGAVPQAGALAGAMRAPKPVYGGTLRLDVQSPPSVMDPARCEEIVCAQFAYLIFNTLVTYAPTSAKIEPSLAQSWKIGDGGRTYTFYLRHGVTFQNGDPFTAQDVVYTLTRVNEKATAAPYQGAFSALVGAPALFSGKASTLAGISAEGKYTVVMHLSTPEAYWLNVLALPSASIVDPAVAAQWDKVEAGKSSGVIVPVGTGPFSIKPFGASPTEYVLEKNPHYFVKGRPYLNSIVIRIGASPQLMLEQFERGEIDAIPGFLDNVYMGPSQYLQVLKSPTLKSEYIHAPDIGFAYLYLDPQIKPFNNLDLRIAITYALNKRDLSEVLTNGRGPVANSILPPGMPGYDPKMDAYPVNYNSAAGLAKAQELARHYLKLAGYPNGVNIGTFIVIQGPGDQQLAGLVSSELKAVGIVCTPRIVANGPYVSGAIAGKWGFAQSAWFQDYPDPQDFLYNLFDSQEIPGNNFVHYKNPTVDRLIQKADGLLNMKQRIPLYQKAEEIILKSAVVIPYNWEWQDGMVGKNVYPKNPLIWLHPVLPAQLDRVWIAK
jgi:ABC-type transport system substrate-binding protein